MTNIGDHPNITSHEVTGHGIHEQLGLSECDICFTEVGELNQCPHCMNKVCGDCWVECGKGHYICKTCKEFVNAGARIKKG